MPTRFFLLLFGTFLITGCGGGDKHLPSSNPPEYDPKKVYTVPAALPNTAAVVQPVVPPPSSPAKSPPMDPVALRKALEAADRTRDILKKVESLDSKGQLHAILESMMLGEQAPPELRPLLKESFDAHKVQIHQAFEQQYNRYQQALDEEHKSPTIQLPLRKSSGSEPFSLFRVSGRGARGAHMPWMHLVDLPRGTTVSLEPDCCGAWQMATIPDSAFEGGDFSLEIKSAGRYNSDKDHISVDGEAITTTTKVVAGDKATVKVKITKKNRAVVNRCPSASGVVPGAASIYEEMGYNVSTPTTNHSAGIFVHDRAKTEAHTDEEGLVQEITMEITAEDLDGETGQVLRQASGNALKKRDMPVVCSGCTARVADAAKKLGQMASWNYYNAEQLWRKPVYSADACVKIHFTPATKTVLLSPGGSTKVKAELRTIGGDQATEGRLFELQELHDGKVTPKDMKTSPASPAEFSFTAPQKKWTKSELPGFRVLNSSSKAGRAGPEEWELGVGLKLRFGQRIMADPQSVKAKMGMAQFDGIVQFDIPLMQYAEGLFRGEITLVRPMVVRHVKYGTCGSASRTEHWLVTAHVNPKSESMDVQFGFTTSNEQGSWTCGGITDELHDDLFEILESANMPTKTGIKKEYNARNQEFLEWLSVEVVEGLD
jgi:hypothetical protein